MGASDRGGAVNVIEHFRNARKVFSLPAGTELFKAGDKGDAMYLLLEGSANVFVGSTVVEIAEAGALLGEMALVDAKERSATVITRTLCRVVPIGIAEFDLLVHETPAFGRHVMKVMADRLRRMNDNLSATQRITGVHTRVTTRSALSLEKVPAASFLVKRFQPGERR
jgi:CRP/FNR family transcriptional regulator, cyclic AMP receptor protein